MKKCAVLMTAFCATMVMVCTDDIGDTTPMGSSTPGIGGDSLTSLCEGNCDIDSSSGYIRTGNEVTIMGEGDTGGVKLNFTTIDDEQAVATVDTSIIPPQLGEAEIVLERVTGSGGSLEDDMWRLDTVKLSNDSLGIDAAIPVPGNMLFVLDSETGELLSTVDTTGTGQATQELMVSAVASCPLLILGPLASGDAGQLAPIDSVDAVRSTCDTTWGYKNGNELYVTSNNVDTLFFHDVSSATTTPMDLNALVALMSLLGAAQGLPAL